MRDEAKLCLRAPESPDVCQSFPGSWDLGAGGALGLRLFVSPPAMDFGVAGGEFLKFSASVKEKLLFFSWSSVVVQ